MTAEVKLQHTAFTNRKCIVYELDRQNLTLSNKKIPHFGA